MSDKQYTVIEYIVEEVTRQGHDVMLLDGIERVGWMINAWSYALRQSADTTRLTMSMAIELGRMVECLKGIRQCQVRVGRKWCPNFKEVPEMLEKLFNRKNEMSPMEFYKAFEEIHPFIDGNGRTGKIILNWLNGTLLSPIFPPDNLWGRPILNP